MNIFNKLFNKRKPDTEYRLEALTQEKNFYKRIAEECISQLLLTEDVRYSEERGGYYWVSNGELVGESNE